MRRAVFMRYSYRMAREPYVGLFQVQFCFHLLGERLVPGCVVTTWSLRSCQQVRHDCDLDAFANGLPPSERKKL